MRQKSSFLADFHIHSTFSDGKLSIPELVDFYGKLGFGAIAITDHIAETHTTIGKVAVHLGHTLTPATFPLYKAILDSEAERAWDQYKMVVIPGFELSKNSISNQRSGHIVGLGVSRWMQADGRPEDLIDEIHDQGALAIAAHPVHTRKFEKQTYLLWDQRRELSSKFDAWEVASGPHLFPEVANEKIPVVASSDLHQPRQMTSYKTELYCEKKPEAILAAIKRQELGVRFFEHNDDSLCA